MMFAKYFEYYTIILMGPFFRGHAVVQLHNAYFLCADLRLFVTVYGRFQRLGIS